MVTTETYLKTQQVAQALGVSVSSIKRWVDTGVLEATRTVGKHRLVLLSSALSFARRENFPVTELLAMSSASPTTAAAVDDQLRELLFNTLKQGDDRLASSLIMSAYQAHSSVVELADQLIRPTMERIGHAWFLGQWDIYEEHQATRLIASTLAGINYSLIQAAGFSLPLALGASPEGDPYLLPGFAGGDRRPRGGVGRSQPGGGPSSALVGRGHPKTSSPDGFSVRKPNL